MWTLFFTASLLIASPVAAHGGVTNYKIDGVLYKGYQAQPNGASSNSPDRLKTHPPGGPTIQHEWRQLHPIRELNSHQIACNSPGTPGKISAPIKAGGIIQAQWSKWPHQSGPVLVYMAECPGNCASANPSSLDWFKIFGAGLLGGTAAHGRWAAGDMVKNNNSLTTTIPMLKPGNYLIRHETINLAQSDPEFYMECAQLKVTGSGTLTPPKSVTVRFPGAYKRSDSQLYRSNGQIKDTSNWQIPGPPVWRGAGGGGSDYTAVPNIGKGKSLFFDKSDYIDLTVPEPEDL